MIQENVAVNLLEKRNGKSEGAFRTISEVAEELDVPQHVLRFWESRFSQIRPLKRGGNRRYYRPEDVLLLYRIRDLLYKEGYTIKGVQRILKGSGVKGVLDTSAAASDKILEQKEQELSFDLSPPSHSEAVEISIATPVESPVIHAPELKKTAPEKTSW